MSKIIYNKIRTYWNKRPCNIRHSRKKLFSKEYFEEVKKKRYFVESHIKKFAEFKDYMNPHDNCLWDAIIPGYEHRLKPDSHYKSQKIIGMLLLSDGNHKIAVRVNKPGYNKSKAKKDIKTYVNNYLSSYLARKKHSRGEWVEISGF